MNGDIAERYKRRIEELGGDKGELVKEYQTKIAERLGEKPIEVVSYSEAYKEFKRAQFGRTNTLFEKLCNLSAKTLKVVVKPADKKKIENMTEGEVLDYLFHPKFSTNFSFLW